MAKKLFKLSSETIPTIYQQDGSREATLERFRLGWEEDKYLKHVNDPTFKCEEITPQQLIESLPDEFQIIEDTSF
jgi:hypothetical protein